jgi:hypothetical protein
MIQKSGSSTTERSGKGQCSLDLKASFIAIKKSVIVAGE